MALKHVNAVIVGAGAGGGVVAKELATAGLSVVLLERGQWYTAADCRKDDLRNQRTSPLGNNSGPDQGQEHQDQQIREAVHANLTTSRAAITRKVPDSIDRAYDLTNPFCQRRHTPDSPPRPAANPLTAPSIPRASK